MEVNMKRKLFTTMAIVVLVGVINFNTGAQTSSQHQWNAHVPFAFSVGKVILPAGEYTVRIVNPTSDHPVLLIQNKDGGSCTTVRTIVGIGKPHEEAQLTFRRYGEGTSLSASMSPAEKIAFRETRLTNGQSSVVAVATR
jgi:hypothetical protein